MAKSTRKIYMSDETFSGLMESAEQARAFERGERENYRVTRVTVPGYYRQKSGGDVMSSGERRGSRRKPKKSVGRH
jgi:hypothetical protein